MSEGKIITDAYQWSYDRYIKDDPELVEFAADARAKALLSMRIYDIRNKLRMSREDLAEFSGLTATTIEDLEESDYDGDWDAALTRIDAAFRSWITDVVLPVAAMAPDEYSVKAANA